MTNSTNTDVTFTGTWCNKMVAKHELPFYGSSRYIKDAANLPLSKLKVQRGSVQAQGEIKDYLTPNARI